MLMRPLEATTLYELMTASGAGNELVVVDVASRKVVKRVAIGKAPEGILMDPSGTRAFVAVSGDNYVAIFDLDKLSVTGRLETGTGPDGMAWIR